MESSFEDIEVHLSYFDQIENEFARNEAKNKLCELIGYYLGRKEKWEELKSKGYQKDKKEIKRLYSAELKKQIDITKKFLIRLDDPMPVIENLPRLSDLALDEIKNYFMALNDININKEIDALMDGDRPTKKPIEEHIRTVTKKYRLVGAGNMIQDLLPIIE